MYSEINAQYYEVKPPILAGPYPILRFVYEDKQLSDMIAKFASKGTKVAEMGLSAAEVASKPQSEMASMRIPPKGFAGGIRAPHVHYNGEIYLLSSDEWRAFSGRVIEGFRAKLADAHSISYDQMTRLADIMQEIV